MFLWIDYCSIPQMVTALTEDLVLGCLSETSRVAKHETGHHRRRVPERLSRLLEGSFVATFRQQRSAVAIKEEEEEEARGEVGEVGGEVGDTRETKGEDIERRDGDGDGGDIITHQTSSDHRHLAPTNKEGWKKFNKIMLGRAVESSTSTSSFAHALIVLSTRRKPTMFECLEFLLHLLRSPNHYLVLEYCLQYALLFFSHPLYSHFAVLSTSSGLHREELSHRCPSSPVHSLGQRRRGLRSGQLARAWVVSCRVSGSVARSRRMLCHARRGPPGYPHVRASVQRPHTSRWLRFVYVLCSQSRRNGLR